MCKTLSKFFFASLAVIFSVVPAFASVNLYFNIPTANQMNISLNNDDEYTIVTAGTDPFVSTTGLLRSLADDEVLLTFEYCSTAATDHLQFFFGPSYSELRSKRCAGLPKSPGWSTYTLNISEEIRNFVWGAQSSFMRFDFGATPGVGIIIRHIRITSVDNDPGWTPDNRNPSFDETLQLGLPVIDITTVNNEEPKCDYVQAPPGSIGAGIRNATKVPGRVCRYEPDGTLSFDSGDYLKGETGMTIKIRGNTSAYQARKPYKIKLQSKADLLARGNKKFNDKNWLLLNDYDMMHRNGYWVNELIGMDWTPQSQYVNVRINNEYRGVYLLCEAVERNTDCRIDVSKNGFITELDAYWWNEDGYVPSNASPTWNYTFKYPDYEDITPEQLKYAANAMAQFEHSVQTGMYHYYIDSETFAAWAMGHDILGTIDYGGSNMYFSKYDNTTNSKIRRPTMWDFDSSEQSADSWSNTHLHHHGQLFKNRNTTFVRAFARLWQYTGQFVCDKMVERLYEFKQSEEAAAYDRSATATNLHWGLSLKPSAQCTLRSINWYKTRGKWLSKAMQAFSDYFETTGTDNIESETAVMVNGRTINTADSSPFSVHTTDGRTIVRQSTTPVEIAVPGLYIIVHRSGTQKIIIH